MLHFGLQGEIRVEHGKSKGRVRRQGSGDDKGRIRRGVERRRDIWSATAKAVSCWSKKKRRTGGKTGEEEVEKVEEHQFVGDGGARLLSGPG